MGQLKRPWPLIRHFAKKNSVLVITLGLTVIAPSLFMGIILRNDSLTLRFAITALVTARWEPLSVPSKLFPLFLYFQSNFYYILTTCTVFHFTPSPFYSAFFLQHLSFQWHSRKETIASWTSRMVQPFFLLRQFSPTLVSSKKNLEALRS